jgi:hypothetical protein
VWPHNRRRDDIQEFRWTPNSIIDSWWCLKRTANYDGARRAVGATNFEKLRNPDPSAVGFAAMAEAEGEQGVVFQSGQYAVIGGREAEGSGAAARKARRVAAAGCGEVEDAVKNSHGCGAAGAANADAGLFQPVHCVRRALGGGGSHSCLRGKSFPVKPNSARTSFLGRLCSPRSSAALPASMRRRSSSVTGSPPAGAVTGHGLRGRAIEIPGSARRRPFERTGLDPGAHARGVCRSRSSGGASGSVAGAADGSRSISHRCKAHQRRALPVRLVGFSGNSEGMGAGGDYDLTDRRKATVRETGSVSGGAERP